MMDQKRRVHFVRATQPDEGPSSSREPSKEESTLTGEEARSFYEAVIATSSSSNQPITPSTSSSRETHRPHRRSPPPPPLTARDFRLFLKAAADHDLPTVQHYCCQRGMDLEVMDDHNWTALMCAAAAGSVEVCSFLLRRGAKVEHTDRSGRTAEHFAEMAGHVEVLRALEKYRSEQMVQSLNDQCEVSGQKEGEEEGYCSLCEVCYLHSGGGGGREAHTSSMVHVINSGQIPSQGYAYGIGHTNRGYRLLKRAGWSEMHGLGKNEEGRKYPIKVALKRDLKGLGHGKPPVKHVTHPPQDVERGGGKRMKIKKIIDKQRTQDRQMEMQLRRMI